MIVTLCSLIIFNNFEGSFSAFFSGKINLEPEKIHKNISHTETSKV